MTDSESSDDSWEKFFGQSTDLMPSIMGAFDAIIGTKSTEEDASDTIKTSTPKRTYQANNFANLSPGVQKILSHVPDQEISKHFSSEETLGPRRFGPNKTAFRSLRSSERTMLNSTENLERISPNVQKILSNLPDTELVITPKKSVKNTSYLHKEHLKRSYSAEVNEICGRQSFYASDAKDFASAYAGLCDRLSECGENSEVCDSYSPKPLGSYLHSAQGIASRTPVGRKNLGKFLQVPSESSVGTMSSTTSSEVSRPVSLTSLGSCSSSGSSGPQQPGSNYLASAESLDSDNEHGGSADSGIAEQPITPEMRVLQEVLDTETVYVSDLYEVIQGYLEPWKVDPDCPLAPHLQHLFSNIVEIHEFNRKLLKELRIAECNPTEIAKVFLQNHSGFSVYNEYCTNYPKTMDVLGQLQRDEKMVPLFKERQLGLGHALPLGSYLLKPVQRILKYHLLLQRLSKQCECIHRSTVDLALTTMTGIASEINNMKRKHENAVRVQEILAQLYGWLGPDLTALGELIAEGTFKLIGARAKRHVFLFEKVLLLAKRKENGVLVYKSHIMCSNLMLIEQVRGEPLCFHVIPFDNPKMQSTLRARSLQNKREWTLQIKRVILENFDAKIPSHARELVMELGKDSHENEPDTPNDKWSTYKPYSTPDYLERRSRVRKSRNLRRASSQDRTFTSLSNWRRKSEPDMIPQYTSKTMPKRISQMKKAKEVGTAKFYTDLSDSETCDNANESMESLPQNTTEDISEKVVEEEASIDRNNLEKIVSELLQQSRPEFNKLLSTNQTSHRSRRTLPSDQSNNIWYEDRSKLPSKADSLPRSFQLNDQIEDESRINECKNEQLILDQSLKENPDDGDEEQQENDLSSQLDDNEHPEHKIYRKSLIRLSVVQRLRNLMFEDQKTSTKSSHSYKQGSKRMGEKIAHPDYADPQKLFLGSRNSSQISLSSDSFDKTDGDCDFGEREELDLSINENDVLKEFEKRLKRGANISDTGQYTTNGNSSHSEQHYQKKVNSSQNSDSYYETLLDKSLTEEYVKDASGRMIAKQDSFNNNESKLIYQLKYNSAQNITVLKKETILDKKPLVKRPSKAPPPIPIKPTIRVTNGTNDSVSSSNSFTKNKSNKSDNFNSVETISNSSNISCNRTFLHNQNGSSSVTTQSWVKTVVNRFE